MHVRMHPLLASPHPLADGSLCTYLPNYSTVGPVVINICIARDFCGVVAHVQMHSPLIVANPLDGDSLCAYHI